MAFISAALVGTAATAATATTAATAATAGLFGTAGAVTASGLIGGLFQVVGFATQFIGRSQQADLQQQEFAFREAQLRNQGIIAGQNIQREREQEDLRQRLLSEEGRRRRGEIRVAQAGLGQLVDVGSAADITEELASEVAFKKLISQNESAQRARNLRVQAGEIEADIGINSLRAKSAASAASTRAFGSILETGSRLTRRFRFGGSAAFGGT